MEVGARISFWPMWKGTRGERHLAPLFQYSKYSLAAERRDPLARASWFFCTAGFRFPALEPKSDVISNPKSRGRRSSRCGVAMKRWPGHCSELRRDDAVCHPSSSVLPHQGSSPPPSPFSQSYHPWENHEPTIWSPSAGSSSGRLTLVVDMK